MRFGDLADRIVSDKWRGGVRLGVVDYCQLLAGLTQGMRDQDVLSLPVQFRPIPFLLLVPLRGLQLCFGSIIICFISNLTHTSQCGDKARRLTSIPSRPSALSTQRHPVFILQMPPCYTPGILAIICLATRPTRVHLEFASPHTCLLYTSPSPRDGLLSRMPSSA